MKITSDEIRKALKTVWPDLSYIVLSDPEWALMPVSWLDALCTGYKPPAFLPGVFECEEIALDFMVDERKRHARTLEDIAPAPDPRDALNRPLGFVIGSRFRGQDMDHYCNITVTEAGVRLVEPQTQTFWIPERGQDDIYFLFM